LYDLEANEVMGSASEHGTAGVEVPALGTAEAA
jgi:hypothetical protein